MVIIDASCRASSLHTSRSTKQGSKGRFLQGHPPCIGVAPPASTQVSREVTAAMIKWDQDGDLLSIITIYGQDPDGDLRRL